MSLDYTKTTVGEIKDSLIAEGRLSKEDVAEISKTVKGKSNWVKVHKGERPDETPEEYEWGELSDELDNLIGDVGEGIDIPLVPPRDPDIPRYQDPGWNDYVMAQFDEAELIDGKYPNVNSLRRLVELLLGDIVFSGPISTQTTLDPNHTGKAVVTYKVTIDWKLDAMYAGGVGLEGYPQREFLSVASSWIGNTDDTFAVFAESIAETRAEGRALRRALRINVVCADELTKKDTAAIVQQQKDTVSTTGEWEEESLITDQQINTITMMCDRLGIDLNKFINSGSKTYDSIDKVTRATAAGMLKQLNRYQSSGGDAIEIPQNIIGD